MKRKDLTNKSISDIFEILMTEVNLNDFARSVRYP